MPKPISTPRVRANSFGLMAAAEFVAAAETGKQPTFKINAYNGGPINVSAFWGAPAVIDLSGLKAHSERIPILLDHDATQIVGQADKIDITARKVNVSGVFTGNAEDPTDPAGKVAAHARNGFVWAASVGVRIDKYEFIDADGSAVVNGRKVTGPVYVVRQGALGEVSFVASGADGSASANIAATAAGGIPMEFKEWLKASGFDHDALTDDQKATLRAAFETEQGTPAQDATPAAEPEQTDATDPIKASRIAAANEQRRVNAIRSVCGNEYGDICANAIAEGWSAERAELAVWKARDKASKDKANAEIRASRGNVNIIAPKAPTGADRLKVIEAAACRDLRLPGYEQAYKSEVLEAADKTFRRSSPLGLQGMLLEAAEMGGMTERVRRITDGSLKMVLHHAFNLKADAGFSMNDFGNAISSIANKFSEAAYRSVNQAWRKVARTKPVNDFKAVKGYRLNTSGDYEQVGPGGTLKSGTIGTTEYSNQAATYGQTLAIAREHIINDDAGILRDAPTALGLAGARKFNSVFWAKWIADTGFWKTDNSNSNYISGSTTNLGMVGLQAGLKAFRDMKLEDGKTPTGFTPKLLVVPNALEVAARELYVATYVLDTNSSSRTPNANVFANSFEPVVVPYLTNATAWYLLADPMEAAAIEAVFLNGNELPVVEQAEADFDTLGIQMRSYFDFGVEFYDIRAGIKSKGAA